MDKSSILDNWPITSPPRPNQITALNWISEQTAKYIICEMPVGSGKSLIGLTLSRHLSNAKGDAFILTPQRILQQQYEQTLNDNSVMALYGKNNYTCKTKNTTCDIGSLVKPDCANCTCKFAFSKAQRTSNVVLNYRLGMLLFGHTDAFKARKLMILDECHTLEDHLTEFDAVTLYKHASSKFKVKWTPQSNIRDAIKWITNVYLVCASNYKKTLYDKVEPLFDKSNSDLSKAEVKSLTEYSKLEDYLDEITELVYTPIKTIEANFVLVHDSEMIKFKPLTGADTFSTTLKPMADQFLFMSSTILDHVGFCEDLGLDMKDVAFISLESDFPKENRPVVYMPQMKMNARWKLPEQEKSRIDMISAISTICKLHDNESGIIHTGNFQVANWLVNELMFEVPQQVLHHNPESGDDRNAIINQYMNTATRKPTLLISPSITEGLDLCDDLARFAIFCKLGYPHLGDQWIKRRFDISQKWYTRKTMINVIQGGGRIVRSDTDSGRVYIVDGSFGYLYSQTKAITPKWWRDAYEVIC